ncbi:uncharacterized protein cubi_02113 [Cryptosporidium ubiquitum]|uniref:tRNA-uridine aminocarboxypropyltransferase n=1 Tax=Cryptosporidium ubiquitum TaxID=857276 RepID=A0A1J4MN46_9CRYT|nr:uncharacterized protein cubi_02113 [Cryptosporidium ubiquitum]OII75592.1 hypothetical protein cubi_02113 [Cryptosporidium ubiquitum]
MDVRLDYMNPTKVEEGIDVEILEGKINSLNLEDLDPREKYSRVVQKRFERSMKELDERENQSHPFVKCRSCFLVKKDHCICTNLSRLADQIKKVQTYPEIKFIIFMNDREYFRSSNTGKLVKHLIPGSEILIHGIPGSSERLEEILSQDLEIYNETVILYPSKDSKSVLDYFSDLKENKYFELLGKEPENSLFSTEFYRKLKLKVILIDGTWSQAKSINKSLPKQIKRIVINSKLISDFGPLRKQNKAGNISTVEASSLLIKEIREMLSNIIGDSITTENLSHLNLQSDLLEESLKLLIKHVIAQCKREYLKEILESRNEKRFSTHKRETL